MCTRTILSVISLVNLILCLEHHQIKNHNNSQILFPEAKKTDTQEIPMEVIRRLNTLSSVEEFFKSMVDSKQPDLADRMGLGPLDKGSLRGGRTGKCMPEYTTVSLIPDQTTAAFYYPRCTRVRRCGGCCLHDLFSCRPIEKEFIPVTVAIAEYHGGHQFHLKERKIIDIEQHTKCECGCKIQPENCTKYQKYNVENCRCECPNIEKEKKCYKKIWNPDICSCICRDELTCGTGFEFDPFTCSCTPRGRKKSSFIYRVYV